MVLTDELIVGSIVRLRQTIARVSAIDSLRVMIGETWYRYDEIDPQPTTERLLAEVIAEYGEVIARTHSVGAGIVVEIWGRTATISVDGTYIHRVQLALATAGYRP